MNLNPVEWTAAQEMLLELVTVLSDDKTRDVPSLARRLISFNPFSNSTSNDASTLRKKPIPHSVRLLPTLQTAQTKMSHWIEDLSKDKSFKGSDASSLGKISLDKRGQPEPSASKAPVNVGASEQPMRKIISDVGRDAARREKETPVSASSEKHLLRNMDEAVSLGKIGTSVASRTHKLVEQVRVAIQTLSSSTFLENPQPAPFRAALMRLKPLVDALIEVLSQNELDPHADGGFRHKATPANSRFQLMPKNTVFSLNPQETRSMMNGSMRVENHDNEARLKMKERKISGESLQESRKSNEEKNLPRASDSDASGSKAPDKLASLQKPERVAIPGAPYSAAPVFTDPSSTAKKKKQKRYFFQEEEETDSDPYPNS